LMLNYRINDGPWFDRLKVKDSVIYHFSDQRICHYEVEIEAKAKDSSIVLKNVIESLVAMYEPVLRRWDHGKLVTGKVIEKLLSEGSLEELLDTNDHLKPDAYDTIEGYFKLASV